MTDEKVRRQAARRIINEAMGYGSMCWNPKPTGVFDDAEASRGADMYLDQMMLAWQASQSHEPTADERARAEAYAESCDNESGSFLSRDLIKIREKGYLAGLASRQAEIDGVRECVLDVIDNLKKSEKIARSVFTGREHEIIYDCLKSNRELLSQAIEKGGRG